jgi:hypothetical protein
MWGRPQGEYIGKRIYPKEINMDNFKKEKEDAAWAALGQLIERADSQAGKHIMQTAKLNKAQVIKDQKRRRMRAYAHRPVSRPVSNVTPDMHKSNDLVSTIGNTLTDHILGIIR